MSKNSDSTAPIKRKTWTRNIDFILSIVGTIVGLGNVWRFPYLCYKNGGGAFLIPYFTVILVLALPLMILESAIGQYCGRSAIKAWTLVPLMRGIGYANIIWLFLCNLYYPVILAWALRWLVVSFSSTLPWITCGNDWNTEHCVPIIKQTGNRSLETDSSLNYSSTQTSSTQLNRTSSSTEEYWKRNILGLTSGLNEPGGIKWDLFACLATIWVLTYFCIWKGISWTSKIVYVTATLPLVMILVVMVRGITLEGAGEGIRYYLQPNMTKLQEIEIWSGAASQVIFSFVVCSGVITTVSEYNRFHHNFFRDTMILVFANACASFMAGFAIFSVLGFLAKNQNSTIADVVDSGPGLVFVAYPTALSFLPLPQLWCIIFFLMLILLGFDSQFIFQESLVACLKDLYPVLFKKMGREIVVLAVSIPMLLLGITMVTRGGMYVFYIFDNYAVAGWGMFFIGTCELIVGGWMYGADRMCDNIHEMIGYNIPRFWFKFCWKFAGPVLASVIMIYSLVQYKPLTYDRTYVYPVWANALGWMLALSSMLWIPCTAIYSLWNADGQSLCEKFKATLVTPKEWGEDKGRGRSSIEEMKIDKEKEEFM